MANLKEIRTRVASVKTTRQITSAMKMVSAAKLRRAQDAVLQMRPFANKLQQILFDLAGNIESEEVNIFKEEREVKKALLIVITSNKGLCGAFNSNIVKQTIADINLYYKALYEQGNLEILCIGKKGSELLRSKKITVTNNMHDLIDDVTYNEAKDLAVSIISKFRSEEYDLVRIYYNQFKNAANQIPIAEQYLPFPEMEEEEDTSKATHDYILEPTKEQIVEDLIPKSLKMQLFKALLDSSASEQGARMTAMHKATDNASDLIKELQLEYNKARQSSITNEILEIVGGAEALKG